MTDKNNLNLGTNAGDAAAERRARLGKSLGKVVTFLEADMMVHEYETDANGVSKAKVDGSGNKILRADPAPEMVEAVAKMTKFMEQIDKEPDNFDYVNGFGSEAIKKIGTASKNSIAVQAKFNSSLNTMKAAQDELENSGFKEFVDGGKKLLGAGANAGKQALGMMGKFFKMFAPKEKPEDKSEETRTREELDKTLPRMMQTMNTILNKIERSDDALKQVIGEAKKFGFEQFKGSEELALYIGCREEVLRRYDEQYIPEAHQLVAENGADNAETQQYLTDVTQRRTDFAERIYIITQAKTSCDNSAAMLHQQVHSMENQRKVVRQTMDTAKPLWEAQLANLGLISSSLKQAELNKQAGDFSDSIFRANMDLSEKAIRMTIDAKNKGVVDYDLLIENAQRIENLIGECRAAEINHANMIAEKTTGLLEINNRLIDAAQEAKGINHLIDQSEAPAATNDNDAAAPAAEAAPAAKKTARGPRASKGPKKG